jgi:hypothetical protein
MVVNHGKNAPMQKTFKLIICITALISLGLLSGCVTLNQEITVREDGSGTLRFMIGVESEHYEEFQEAIPEGYELENLFATLARDEHITSTQIDQYTQDGLTWDSIELDVVDFTAAFGQTRRIGPLSIEFDQTDEALVFTQRIDVANSTLTIPGINLMDLSDASFVVNLSTPQIISTNGVQPAGGVSTWSIPLDEVLQGGSTAFLRANYVLEPYEGVFIPWELFFPYVVIGFLGLGGIAILVVILRNTAFKPDKRPKLKFK